MPAKPKCAVFGIINHPHAAHLTYFGLHALQHRGQESAGIVSFEDTKTVPGEKPKKRMICHKGFGLVLDVFNDPSMFSTKLSGSAAIGHTRYSTAGSQQSPFNIQPFIVQYKHGNLSLAHNGNISNFKQLKKHFVDQGTLFQSTSDSEIILHLIAHSKKEAQVDQIIEALCKVEGAFSLVLLTDEYMYLVRDPNGFRPLVLGQIGDEKSPNGVSFCAASETCALDLINAKLVREVEPGEILAIHIASSKKGMGKPTVSASGVVTIPVAPAAVGDAAPATDAPGVLTAPAPAEADGALVPAEPPAFKSYRLPSTVVAGKAIPQTPCVFEFIYFARPDSMIFGGNVGEVRQACGRQMARECPIPKVGPSDAPVVVIPVPDSANASALGYQQECLKLGYPCTFEFGIIRNHYVGRTFIAPSQDIRDLAVRCKFNAVSHRLKDKIVVLVDDSIVRGTTSKQLIKMVRDAGAREVHFRVASPPVISPCYYGMDFPTRQQLLANNYPSIDAMTQALKADSLAYLSVKGMMEAVGSVKPASSTWCAACFTGVYPVPVADAVDTKDAIDW